MKALVTVKEDAVVDGDLRIDCTRVNWQYLTYELNEWDNYVIEEAVQLSEARDDVDVVEDEDPYLVLTSVQGDDNANGATGGTLAEIIGYEWGTVVSTLDIADDAERSVQRELEGGVEDLHNT